MIIDYFRDADDAIAIISLFRYFRHFLPIFSPLIIYDCE